MEDPSDINLEVNAKGDLMDTCEKQCLQDHGDEICHVTEDENKIDSDLPNSNDISASHDSDHVSQELSEVNARLNEFEAVVSNSEELPVSVIKDTGITAKVNIDGQNSNISSLHGTGDTASNSLGCQSENVDRDKSDHIASNESNSTETEKDSCHDSSHSGDDRAVNIPYESLNCTADVDNNSEKGQETHTLELKVNKSCSVEIDVKNSDCKPKDNNLESEEQFLPQETNRTSSVSPVDSTPSCDSESQLSGQSGTSSVHMLQDDSDELLNQLDSELQQSNVLESKVENTIPSHKQKSTDLVNDTDNVDDNVVTSEKTPDDKERELSPEKSSVISSTDSTSFSEAACPNGVSKFSIKDIPEYKELNKKYNKLHKFYIEKEIDVKRLVAIKLDFFF